MLSGNIINLSGCVCTALACGILLDPRQAFLHSLLLLTECPGGAGAQVCVITSVIRPGYAPPASPRALLPNLMLNKGDVLLLIMSLAN